MFKYEMPIEQRKNILSIQADMCGLMAQYYAICRRMLMLWMPAGDWEHDDKKKWG